MEIIKFKAFSDENHNKSLQNCNQSTKIAALHRKATVLGKMHGFGNRVGMGAGPGDGLREFEGMNATTEEGVNEFFNMTEVCTQSFISNEIFRNMI